MSGKRVPSLAAAAERIVAARGAFRRLPAGAEELA
jgi:hypothetical protein